ncbi:hypothetical protein Ark11_0100 [Candidatus Ichthyocystis hellenicum]|uniref:Uncharacterized protein n=1 Tax=Candidatus Ichthyocystis hellenicum TaxID=1561003 RepID=A0A0S4M1R2_9BURK|nr:hypothetical protein Ark11_0100 [Candidatus Ichthyocystis hellenicum]
MLYLPKITSKFFAHRVIKVKSVIIYIYKFNFYGMCFVIDLNVGKYMYDDLFSSHTAINFSNHK